MSVMDLLNDALQEMMHISPTHAQFAMGTLDGCTKVVFESEKRLKRMSEIDPAAAEFAGRGVEKIYALLFTTKGVSESTAAALVSKLRSCY